MKRFVMLRTFVLKHNAAENRGISIPQSFTWRFYYTAFGKIVRAIF